MPTRTGFNIHQSHQRDDAHTHVVYKYTEILQNPRRGRGRRGQERRYGRRLAFVFEATAYPEMTSAQQIGTMYRSLYIAKSNMYIIYIYINAYYRLLD